MTERWRWLNAANPRVRQALEEYKNQNQIPQWEQLGPMEAMEFELSFAKEYILNCRRQGYPFFLNPGSQEVAEAMEVYGQRHGIPHGCPWPDAIRDAFEMDFAAVRLGIATQETQWNWSQWIRDRQRQAGEEKKRREEKRCYTEAEGSTPAQS